MTENEGNIRAVSMMPKVHIVIAGVEKIVSTLEDAMQVVRAAAVYGVGQDIGTYVSVISGVSESLDPDLDVVGFGCCDRVRAAAEHFANLHRCWSSASRHSEDVSGSAGKLDENGADSGCCRHNCCSPVE